MKEINNLIKNKTLLVGEIEKGEPITPCMDSYKENIQPDGSLDKLKLRIVVRGDLQNNWRHLVTNSLHEDFGILLGIFCQAQGKSESVVFIGALLQAKVKNWVFVKLDSRYVDYFTEYSSYFGRAFRLLKYMYGVDNSGRLFARELIDWLSNEEGFKKSQFQISIYYKYAPDETKIVFYLMLIILSIGIHLKVLENG